MSATIGVIRVAFRAASAAVAPYPDYTTVGVTYGALLPGVPTYHIRRE